jgi:hypothetical protein
MNSMRCVALVISSLTRSEGCSFVPSLCCAVVPSPTVRFFDSRFIRALHDMVVVRFAATSVRGATDRHDPLHFGACDEAIVVALPLCAHFVQLEFHLSVPSNTTCKFAITCLRSSQAQRVDEAIDARGGAVHCP